MGCQYPTKIAPRSRSLPAGAAAPWSRSSPPPLVPGDMRGWVPQRRGAHLCGRSMFVWPSVSLKSVCHGRWGRCSGPGLSGSQGHVTQRCLHRILGKVAARNLGPLQTRQSSRAMELSGPLGNFDMFAIVILDFGAVCKLANFIEDVARGH